MRKRPTRAVRIVIRGIVQGVGFRPHAFTTASKHRVTGWVSNALKGVLIHGEGAPSDVRRFICALKEDAPRMASILDVSIEDVKPGGYTGFHIRVSRTDGQRETLLSPDVSTCPDCLEEVLRVGGRHHRYPFTNCTNCGPRFTIVRALPYDRTSTAMSGFPMCPDCDREYRDVRDRRFHAQPVACPECGPTLWLEDASGRRLAEGDAVWTPLHGMLSGGSLAGIKGLGGFHIACSAENPSAVRMLRERKSRPRKALAVMVRDLETAREVCRLDSDDAEILTSPQAPIVILQRRDDPPLRLADDLASGQRSLGIMLPYTPLHHLLLSGDSRVLVMTSGNRRGMPLAIDNQEARRQLEGITDVFLMHDRPIVRRCDDSVVRPTDAGGERVQVIIRRSRGYAPRPLILDAAVVGDAGTDVLATGGEERNTFCLLSGDQAFLSQHMGTLRYEETVEDYRSSISDLAGLLKITPQVVACDLHPAYRSTALAREMVERGSMRLVRVQHHHAHHAAVLAEHGRGQRTIGLVADGFGFGDDGTLWGLEILWADPGAYRRLISMVQVPVPGGERAVQRPLRMALAHLHTFLGDAEAARMLGRFRGHGEDLEVALAQCRRGINAPLTSSCGRLFDAVASLLDVCRRSHYSGQPAVELSEMAGWSTSGYPFSLDEHGDLHLWDLTGMWEALCRDVHRGCAPDEIASRFQRTVGDMMAAGVRKAREITGCTSVTLSGGVFQNPTLLDGLCSILVDDGFEVLLPCEVPINDGGLSLGQAAVARNAPRGGSRHVPCGARSNHRH